MSIQRERARERAPNELELAVLEDLVSALGVRDGQSLGKLHEAVGEGRIDRAAFEALLGAAARLGIVALEDQSFERDGRRIVYRSVQLGPGAEDVEDEQRMRTELRLLDIAGVEPGGSGRRSRAARPKARGRTELAARRSRTPVAAATGDSRLVEALRGFRRDEAKRLGVPAFVVLTDRDLLAIAEAAPTSEDALLAVRGLGRKRVSRYGARIVRLVRELAG